MRVAFLTLGCKVNTYETEKMKIKFEEAGHQIVSFREQSDVYIINTCTVTNIADRKSRKMLHRARRMNPEAIIVAAGCYVDSALKKGEHDESVDVFISNNQKEAIVSILENEVQSRNRNLQMSQYGEQDINRYRMSEKAEEEERTRACVQIQNGCNQFCTYCIIPYVRGPLTSREEEDILTEIRVLAAKGYHEIVVTGIHLSSYGVDRMEGKINADSFLKLQGEPLLHLLKKIAKIEGIYRIRLGSLEPRIVTENFVKKLSKIPQVCPHFHLSLQSGCDETLKRMNRHYTCQQYMEGLAILRKYYQNPAITTDIIVGFPQETEEEFSTTCEFAKKAAFSQIHVFRYSRRYGTVADALSGQIDEAEKVRRSETLLNIENDLEKRYQQEFIGTTQKILLEEIIEIAGKKYVTGYNERYVRAAVEIEEGMTQEDAVNCLENVRITDFLENGMLLAKRE